MKKENQVLIIGIGNTIRGDDGIGILLARKLRETLPQDFEIRESDNGSLDLLNTISGYGKVILIDTIQTPNGKPGEVHRLSLQDLKYSSNLSSMHALGLRQTIELKKRIMDGKIPEKIEVLAVEAKNLDEFSDDLSPELKERFGKIVETVRSEIETGQMKTQLSER
jgi:hydrogenase maturation protease